MPTSMPNMPANMPPNMPNNIPANMPANMPPNIAANISGNVPANNVPVNMPNMPNVPNASGNMQPMPGYMNYPPYNYMHNYMMGGNHNPMMYQAPSHTQQPPPNF